MGTDVPERKNIKFLLVGFEVNFLTSDLSTGGASGEDLDDPIDYDPWS